LFFLLLLTAALGMDWLRQEVFDRTGLTVCRGAWYPAEGQATVVAVANPKEKVSLRPYPSPAIGKVLFLPLIKSYP
jgi:hypothetical protein